MEWGGGLFILINVYFNNFIWSCLEITQILRKKIRKIFIMDVFQIVELNKRTLKNSM